jgi:hypothetical protein
MYSYILRKILAIWVEDIDQLVKSNLKLELNYSTTQLFHPRRERRSICFSTLPSMREMSSVSVLVALSMEE